MHVLVGPGLPSPHGGEKPCPSLIGGRKAGVDVDHPKLGTLVSPQGDPGEVAIEPIPGQHAQDATVVSLKPGEFLDDPDQSGITGVPRQGSEPPFLDLVYPHVAHAPAPDHRIGPHPH